MSQIKDGRGTGQLAKIDRYGRLHGYTVNIKEDAFISLQTEEAYNVTSEIRTFNSTNEHPFFYIKNTNPNKMLIFSTIVYSWNGGNTNYNRAMVKRVYRNVSAPTGNFDNITCNTGALNFSTFKQPALECYAWDGTGDGMIIDKTGKESISTDLIKTDFTYSDLGSVVLGYNNTIMFSYEPEEIGRCSISMKFFYNHI